MIVERTALIPGSPKAFPQASRSTLPAQQTALPSPGSFQTPLISGFSLPQISHISPRAGTDNPYDALRSLSRPALSRKCAEVLNQLVKGYCSQNLEGLLGPERERVEKNIEILEKKPFEIHIAESMAVNALTYPQDRIIYINIGIFKTIIDKHKDSANWDTLAFILAHEIAHTIYKEQTELTEEEKKKYGHHDEEYQCDRDALMIADSAGFNVRFASFDFFPDKEASIDSKNYGLIQSHPNLYQRDAKIKEITRETYLSNYKDGQSIRLFSKNEREEIKPGTPLGTIFLSKNESSSRDLSSGLMRCFDVLVEYLITASQISLREEDLNKEVDFSKAFPDPALAKAFHTFLDTEDKNGVSNLSKLNNAYKKLSRPGKDFNQFLWHWFFHAINKASFKTELVKKLEWYIKKHGASDYDKKEAESLTLKISKMQEIEDSARIQSSCYNKIADEIASLLLPDASKAFLKQLFSKILSIETGSVDFFDSIGSIKEFCTLLSSLPPIFSSSILGRTVPYEKIYKVFLKCIGEYTDASLRLPEDSIDCYKLIANLDALLSYNQIQLSGIREGLKFDPVIFARLFKELIAYNNFKDIEFFLDYIREEDDEMILCLLMKDPDIFNFFLTKGFPFPSDFLPILKQLDLSLYRSNDISKILDILLSENPSLYWSSVLSLTIKDGSADEREKVLKSIPNILENAKKHLTENDYRTTRQIMGTVAGEIILKEKSLEHFNVDDFIAVLTIDPKCINDNMIIEAFNAFLERANIEDLFSLLNVLASAGEKPRLNYISKKIVNRCLLILGLDPSDFPDEYIGCNYDGKVSFRAHYPKTTIDEVRLANFQSKLKKLKDAHFVALIKFIDLKNGRESLLANFIDRLISENRFDEKMLKILTEVVDQTGSFLLEGRHKIPRPPLSEGRRLEELSHLDFIYWRYFIAHGLDSIIDLSLPNLKKWLDEFWPQKTPYRDKVLIEYCKDDYRGLYYGRKDFLSYFRQDQLLILSLFSGEANCLKYQIACYERHADSFSSLKEKVEFLVKVFPSPSKIRDQHLNDILKKTTFTIQEYGSLAYLFTDYSRSYQRKESIALGSSGAILSRLTAEMKASLILWLLGKQEKPQFVERLEDMSQVSLDEIKTLFGLKSFRADLLENIFAGNEGLLAPNNQKVLLSLFDTLLEEHLKIISTDNKAAQNLKKFTRLVIQKFFGLENNIPKKMAVILSLMDLFAGEKPSLNKLIAAFLNSFGVMGVKFAQVLASRPEFRENYPALFELLNNFKDNTNPMSIEEAMRAVMTNPKLRGRKIVFLKPLGSASIKAVFLVEIDGKKAILKVRRAGVYKDLENEAETFGQLLQDLTPDLKEIFGISYLPNYKERVFSWISEEVAFEKELANAETLIRNLKQNSTKKAAISIPSINLDLSNHNTIVEEIAPGIPLREIENDPVQAELFGKIALVLQKAVLDQLFQKRFFHADLHSGNVFVEKNGEQIKITLIDPGFCVSLDEKTSNLIRDLSNPLKRDVYSAIKSFLPADVFHTNQLLIKREADKIQQLDPQKQTLSVLALFDKLSGYKTPQVLVNLLTGISKISFLFKPYPENLPDYLRIWMKP